MASHLLPFLSGDKENFENIKNGLKSVETRAGSPAYLKIKPGDQVSFTCESESILKTIKEVRKYIDPAAAIEDIGLENIMPGSTSVEKAVQSYQHYPGCPERIKKYGILAFFLK